MNLHSSSTLMMVNLQTMMLDQISMNKVSYKVDLVSLLWHYNKSIPVKSDNVRFWFHWSVILNKVQMLYHMKRVLSYKYHQYNGLLTTFKTFGLVCVVLLTLINEYQRRYSRPLHIPGSVFADLSVEPNSKLFMGNVLIHGFFFFGRAYPKYSLIIFTFVTNFINFQILILM